MPSLQQVNLTVDKPEPTGVEQFFSKLGANYKDKKDQVEIGKLTEEYKANRGNAHALEDYFFSIQNSNISPSKRVEAMKNFNEMSKTVIQKEKSLNETASKKAKGELDVQLAHQKLETAKQQTETQKYKTESEKNKAKKSILENDPEKTEERIQDLMNVYGMTRDQANVYNNSGRGVQTKITDKIFETKERGTPLVGNLTQEEKKVVSPEEMEAVSKGAIPTPEETTWPDIKGIGQQTLKESNSTRNENIKGNYKALTEAKKNIKTYEASKILTNSLQNLNDRKNLPTGIEKFVSVDPETGALRPLFQMSGLATADVELYSKNIVQFLKDAKSQFGGNVSNFETKTFIKQIPTLMTSEAGRRLILKQMELVNEDTHAHDKILSDGLRYYDTGNANSIQIEKIAYEKSSVIKKGLEAKLNDVVEASEFLTEMSNNEGKFKDTVLMQKGGRFSAVRKADIEKAKEKGWGEY
jgi:hypothetical protein